MSRRRIRRPKDQEEMYKVLTDRDELGGIFSSFKDIFMLAGIVGFMNKKRKTFTSSLEQIHWNVFNSETDETVINAVALAETGDLTIINTDDEAFDRKITIYEEYAAGGLEYLYDKIMENPRYALDNYFDFLKSMEKEVSIEKKNLKDIYNILSI
ncbi:MULTISPECIES: DNA phosphorothioation-associated protein 4 [Bacillus]|uniref:DNA phosphorothioation-associated protein 4 n=1 Tax=Bacillus TaxID=1386 RepID=UPI00027C013C|nr:MULTISPECIES: DNA phosphorothioation-associated protein 4 [Bacillus]EJV69665.1 dnd system-associated protein 4 [Bacillus wiedmannii]MBY7111617.1 DNA phosphorothioation-associated protein 4 [Bacillus sp. 17RED48]MDW8781332.1 DNA phosphorothioation-associated protein 4 [Bacillus cereus]MDZ4561026.1 DNA phosphorothioation-associated protein 4 [Bacillus cereus]PEO17476.1 DNA phosphorothioation-associated protein 4 [Bacillus wiedmannii]